MKTMPQPDPAPHSPPIIEPMTMADYDSVQAFLSSIAGVQLRSADSRDATERYLQRNPGLSLIARSGNLIVGCIMSGHDGRRGYLHHLAVAPNFRRKGLATLLVQRCLAALQQEGIEKTHIDVLCQNTAAHRYWTELGWRKRTDIIRYSFSTSQDPNV